MRLLLVLAIACFAFVPLNLACIMLLVITHDPKRYIGFFNAFAAGICLTDGLSALQTYRQIC